ncbi:MAG: hypothetical protein HQL43_06945 [Alphaproteobacteria bacterium]|nr:hypothetical protein [Alphaproteobacteria bacterium]
MSQRDKVISEIASKILGLETLESRKRDSLDFHDLSVWSIKEALSAAFEAGLQIGKEAKR